MSVFETLASASLAPALANTLGEQVTYSPAGDSPRRVLALVERGVLQRRGSDGQTRPQYELAIRVARADIPQPTLRGDTVALRKRLGDAADTTLTVAAILEMGQSGGFWRLGLT
jgi:glycosyltransferase A (GT-A) superfamily protein (DUF2064 family)